MAEVSERSKSEMGLAKGQPDRLNLEAPVPLDGRWLEALRPHFGQQEHVVERVEERKTAHLLRGDLGSPEVLLPNGASEATVR